MVSRARRQGATTDTGRDRGPTLTPSEDPLRWVAHLGRGASRVGLVVGLIVALSTHGAASARALCALVEMRDVAAEMRRQLHEFLWATYDVTVQEPPEVEEPKTEEPEALEAMEPDPAKPEPTEPPAPPEEAPDPYDDDTPAAAPGQAEKILTAPENPAAPVDLTGGGFVSGDGTGPGYGYVSTAGTATAATRDPRARVDGVRGGTGAGPVPPKPKDLSRLAGLAGGSSWSCPFPPEANAEQIDRATVVLAVTVSQLGQPARVRIVNDPGYGFGRAARDCALARRYQPALDAEGKPFAATTPPINVRFRR